MSRDYTRFDRCGPGGRNCPCCGPSPKQRPKHDRMVKRRMRQHFKREINEAILTMNDD